MSKALPAFGDAGYLKLVVPRLLMCGVTVFGLDLLASNERS